jgi:proline dehydrogenase
MGILRTALLKGSQSHWLERQVVRRRFTQRAVRRFMPGEDVESALNAAEELRSAGITTVLTRLGENVSNLTEVREVTGHYLDVLGRIKRRSLPCHLSVKLTQLGIDISRDACEEELCRLAAHAGELGNFVWIDMEGSSYTDVTLALFRRIRAEYANVGLCLQAYLRRTTSDLDALASIAPVIRLVKGAYREPAALAFPRKGEVDEQFCQLAVRLLQTTRSHGGTVPGIATHDPALIARTQQLARSTGVRPEAYEFQMLYGIRREDQRRLVNAGQRVRVLISYGSALAERPANLWFVLKSFATG